MVGPKAERSVSELDMRGDIIKTMHRALTERGQALGVADYVIEGGQPRSQITGRLIDRGLHDEPTGEAYALMDGTDGRADHVRFRGLMLSNMGPRSAEWSKSDASGKPAMHGPRGARDPFRYRSWRASHREGATWRE